MKTFSILPLALCIALGSSSCQKKKAADKGESATAASASASATAASSEPDQIPAPANVAAAPADAERTASGLASVVLTKGTADTKPTEWDKVKVHYTGWMKDGKMFDSSVPKNSPATFGVKQVIKGWTEGLQLMTVGEKRRFWIPADLAYGDTPRRKGAPSGQLTFDVELLEIIEGPKPPPVPEDVAAAPADAKKTKSGIAYKVLTKGTGTERPSEDSRVKVHYSGWTTDGKMFDSSVMRNRPSSFSLKGVIKGWTEGVQLMVVGEKTRFWIPGELAYGDKPTRPGAPSGLLVFDIELIEIGTEIASPHGGMGMGKPRTSGGPPPAGAKPATPAPKVAAPKPVAPAAPKPVAPAAPKPVAPAAPKPVTPAPPTP
jgi:peptidylprolyl isomerase